MNKNIQDLAQKAVDRLVSKANSDLASIFDTLKAEIERVMSVFANQASELIPNKEEKKIDP